MLDAYTTQQIEACKQLWCDVLLQAVEDIKKVKPGNRLDLQLRDFFKPTNTTLILCCEVANFDVKDISTKMLRRIDLQTSKAESRPAL